MGFNCGIVGLPNVGKSTIFNALTQTQAAQAANYPFCTIEPNTGMVTVPDARLWVLKDIAKTNVVIPTRIELVDIAGLPPKEAAAVLGLTPGSVRMRLMRTRARLRRRHTHLPDQGNEQ